MSYIIKQKKKESILKPIAKENMSKGGKGKPTLATLNVRERDKAGEVVGVIVYSKD